MPATLRLTLLSTALLDELTFGFFTLALPLLRDFYHLSYDQVGFLFTAGALSSLAVEPAINLLSDRGSKRIPIVAGAGALALAFILAGWAPSYAVLTAACIVIWPGIGAAVGVSQAALIDASLDDAERTMTRWTLLSGVGDLLSPLVVGALAAIALGWTAVCIVAAVLWLGLAIVVASRRFPSSATNAHDAELAPEAPNGLLAGLRSALRDTTLLRWATVVLLADMMDEVFLGFAALYLHDRLRYPAFLTSVALGANLAGSLLALVALDRLTGRVSARTLLPWAAVVTLGGVAALLLAPAVWVAVAGLFCAGAAAAIWYPLAKAAAYARQPGRSGTVRAVLGLGDAYNMALPAICGLLAARFGIAAAVAFLGLSGLGVIAATPRANNTSVALDGAAR